MVPSSYSLALGVLFLGRHVSSAESGTLLQARRTKGPRLLGPSNCGSQPMYQYGMHARRRQRTRRTVAAGEGKAFMPSFRLHLHLHLQGAHARVF